MSLEVRLYNINCDNDFLVEYAPSGYTGDFLNAGTYTQGSPFVIISGLSFNTKYFVKVTDIITGQYVIQSIVTNINENCYDCFTSLNLKSVGFSQTTNKSKYNSNNAVYSATTSISGNPLDVIYVRTTFIKPVTLNANVVVNGVSMVRTKRKKSTTPTSATTRNFTVTLDEFGNGDIITILSGSSTTQYGVLQVLHTITGTYSGATTNTKFRNNTGKIVSPSDGQILVGPGTLSSTSETSCSGFTSDKSYVVTGSTDFSGLTIGNVIFTTYPTIVLNGGGNWITLKDPDYSITGTTTVQVDASGQITDVVSCT